MPYEDAGSNPADVRIDVEARRDPCQSMTRTYKRQMESRN